jgi:starch-binding outer membrane protein, SusD/RagB family
MQSINKYRNSALLHRSTSICKGRKLKWITLASFSKKIMSAFMFVSFFMTGCKKFVEVDAPVTSINEGNVYNNDATATAVLTGLYYQMSTTTTSSGSVGFITITRFAGLAADELDVWNAYNSERDLAYYKNSLFATQASSTGSEIWSSFYVTLIRRCNQAIEGLNQSKRLTPSVKEQLLGEAKFLRALFYFYLVNLYGDVPLVITSDFQQNTLLSRAPKEEVFQFIISELKEAKELLSSVYVDGKLEPYTSNIERVRPTKWAAAALLARVYLYTGDTGDYVKAELEASSVINNSLYSLTPLSNTFLKNSNEAIWQLQPVLVGANTQDAKLFVLNQAPIGFRSSKPFYLNNSLVNVFEQGDDRKTQWTGTYTSGTTTYYFPYKYKVSITGSPLTEYFMVLRLAEQYLIRAEARAQQGNISGAISDVNIIRSRARAAATVTIPNPLPDLPNTLTQQQVLTAVMQERRVELFAELGQRWLDLKRTKTVDAVMTIATAQKGGTWQPYKQLFPISFGELQKAPNLRQNPGY